MVVTDFHNTMRSFLEHNNGRAERLSVSLSVAGLELAGTSKDWQRPTLETPKLILAQTAIFGLSQFVYSILVIVWLIQEWMDISI